MRALLRWTASLFPQGVVVGDWWKDRLDCRQWGAHFPHVAGIAGQSNVGAQVGASCRAVGVAAVHALYGARLQRPASASHVTATQHTTHAHTHVRSLSC